MTVDVSEHLQDLWEHIQRRRSLDKARTQELAQRQTFVGTSKGRGLSTSPTNKPGKSKVVPPVSVVRGATVVEHVTLLSTFNQSIASGGGLLQWEWWSEAAPNQRRGFSTLAANGAPTTTIPVNVTGVLNLRLAGQWGEEQSGGATIEKGLWWREAGDITVRLKRDGSTVGERTYPAGRIVSSRYMVDDDGWEVVAGDVIEVELPNSSGEAQRHRQAEMTYKIIELAANTKATEAWVKIASVDAWGIFNDGTSWWITQGANGDTVSEHDSEWVLQSSFDAGYANNRVRGITSDGADLYLTGDSGGNPDRVKQFTKAGVFVDEFSTADNSAAGLAFDGTDLWVVRDDADDLSRFTLAGSLEDSITLPADRNGLAVHDGRFVIADSAADAIEVRDSAGVVVKTIDASQFGGPTGVWVASDGTVYASKDGDGVYELISEKL